jgi:hypothetical protein
MQQSISKVLKVQTDPTVLKHEHLNAVNLPVPNTLMKLGLDHDERLRDFFFSSSFTFFLRLAATASARASATPRDRERGCSF